MTVQNSNRWNLRVGEKNHNVCQESSEIPEKRKIRIEHFALKIKTHVLNNQASSKPEHNYAMKIAIISNV